MVNTVDVSTSKTSVVLERLGTTPWRHYRILRSIHSTKLPARHPYQTDSIVSIVLDCLMDVCIELGIKPRTFGRFRKLEQGLRIFKVILIFLCNYQHITSKIKSRVLLSTVMEFNVNLSHPT